MVSIATIQEQVQAFEQNRKAGTIFEYEIVAPLNLYDSPDLKALATQAIAHRHVRVSQVAQSLDWETASAIPVVLCEDDYPGWLAIADLAALRLTQEFYVPQSVESTEIQARVSAVIAFAQAAMTQPNEYLWGGTLGPNLDCSGLVQRAFGSQGIWLPRDAYQQEAFVEPIANPGQTPVDLLPVFQPFV